MTLIYRGRKGAPREGDEDFCRAGVFVSGSGIHAHQCTRQPKVVREIDGKKYGFCGIHDPVAVKAKRDKQRAKWQAKQKADDRAQETSRARL